MNSSLDFIATYFTEEKIESLFFIIIAFIAIALAIFFLWIIKYSFFKGMAIPLLLIGSIQLTIGYNIYKRSPNDIYRVEQIVKNNNLLLKKTEVSRMETVIKHFNIHKWVEIALILSGLALILIFKKSPQTFWKGIGLGLFIQAILMLCLDLIAEHRAIIYLDFLSKF